MRIFKRIVKITVIILVLLIAGVILFFKIYTPPLSGNYGKVDYKLYVGDTDDQPLLVTFGGSGGGISWAGEYWSEIRNKLLEEGYAVLALGYFKTENTPEKLDRISISAICDTIRKVAAHPKINTDKIALLGGSRGGELVLNIASRYSDFTAVVALVPGHVTFPALAFPSNTSSWTYKGEEIPYLKIPLHAIIQFMLGDPEKAWKSYVESAENSKARIEVEKINGPVLLMSARDDDLWPSAYMCERIVNRFEENHFRYYYRHYSYDGKHLETRQHFSVVFEFLGEHFPTD